MARLPVPGSDDGTWGDILNTYLLQSHDSGGDLKANTVGSAQLQDDAVDASAVADGALPQSKIQDLETDLSNKVDTADVGAANGVASLNGSTKIPIAQIPTGTTSTTVALGNHTHSFAAGLIYPLEEGYGFHSTTILPEYISGVGSFTGWQVRIWVPADKAITKAAALIGTAAVGTATFAGFAVYTDDGQTKLAEVTDNTVFLSTGYRELTFSSAVAAQSTGRFVRVLVTSNYSTSPPNTAFFVEGGSSGGDALNGGTGVRTAYHNNLSSFPASFNPSTGTGLAGWTETNYLPLILLG